MTLLVGLARALSNPARVLKRTLRLVPNLPTTLKVELDLYDRPNYAYGLHRACVQASALDVSAVTVIEFGVGSGAGLLALERIAPEIERATGVKIRIVGFDTGRGLPPPEDFRDLPYLYRGGWYPMDVELLQSRLSRSDLILGDVKETAPDFLESDLPPIGFVSFDLDYYSSTRDAFAIFRGRHSRYLPRVICFFDDVMNAEALQFEHTGELLAIREFNEGHATTKIGQISGLAGSRPIPALWNEQMYACHFFEHPLYNRHIFPSGEQYVRPLGQ